MTSTDRIKTALHGQGVCRLERSVSPTIGFERCTIADQHRMHRLTLILQHIILTLLLILQQEVLDKYDPSSRVILYGCASPAEGELCSSRTTNDLDFEWEQVREAVLEKLFNRSQTYLTRTGSGGVCRPILACRSPRYHNPQPIASNVQAHTHDNRP